MFRNSSGLFGCSGLALGIAAFSQLRVLVGVLRLGFTANFVLHGVGDSGFVI